MKKYTLIIYTLFTILFLLLGFVVYPETYTNLEASNFFAFTHDYLQLKLSELPLITALLSDYVLQFYRWQGVGQVIDASILLLIGLGLCKIVSQIDKKGYYPLTIALPLALVLFAPFELDVHLQTLFMVALIVLFGYFIKYSRGWIIYTLLFLLTALWLMPYSMFAFAICTMATILFVRKKYKWWYVLAGTVLVLIAGLLFVWAYNAWIDFVPFEKRYFYSCFAGIGTGVCMIIYIASLALLFVPNLGCFKWERIGRIVLVFLLPVMMILVFALQVFNDNLQRDEDAYRIAQMAEKKQWKEILAETTLENVSDNRIKLMYALLAEGYLGQLPEHLFDYPIIHSSALIYGDNFNPMCRNFNRMFYERLGMYDECFRQSHEMSLHCHNGAGFAPMRNMVKYAILIGRYEVAEKYLDILQHSPTHVSWVENWRNALAVQKQKNPNPMASKPIRQNAMTGAYKMGLEMRSMLEAGSDSREIVDCAMLAFLLDCNLKGFLEILQTYPIYTDRPLPKAYAEALAMIVNDTGNNQLRHRFSYNPEYDEQFRQFDMQNIFQQQGKKVENPVNFNGTYWNYFVKVSHLSAAKPE